MYFKFKHTSRFVGLLLLLSSLPVIGALPGESIVLDTNTGDYTITYWDYPNSPKKRLHQAIFVPATKIDPLVKSKLIHKDDNVISYTYRVTNSLKGRQSLDVFLLDSVTDLVSELPLPKNVQDIDSETIEMINQAGIAALTTPSDWFGIVSTNDENGLRVGWSNLDSNNINDGLKPGSTQNGFGFSSRDIPGIGIAQLSGNSPVPMYPAEGPTGELGKEFEKIENNDFVTRPAAVPTIAVPEPFDAAVTLERIQAHMQSWIAMQLLDSAFSAQLDRSFQSAISAYRLNQPKVGKQHIQAMRVLIKKEQPDADREDADDSDEYNKNQRALIDKLAARILDFDLKYVTKRMGGDD